MSTLFQAVTCLSVLAFLCPSQLGAAEQHEYFFAIAEGVPPEVRLAMGNKMQTLIGSELAPGSLVHVLRLPSYQSLATFKVPHGSRSSRLKNRRLAPAWQSVLPFLKNPETKGSTQVDLPRLPAKLRELRQSDFPVRVVLVGSLLYDDPQYPVWKFNPWVPSDGCLKADLCPFTGVLVIFRPARKLAGLLRLPTSPSSSLWWKVSRDFTDFFVLSMAARSSAWATALRQPFGLIEGNFPIDQRFVTTAS